MKGKEKEEMDLTEGVGESSSPPRSFSASGGGGAGGGGSHDLRNAVFNKLIESGHEEAVSNPELFCEQLEAHFNRLPPSYALHVNVNKAEDVVLHRKLLAMAEDPEKRPVFHIRFLENLWTAIDGDDDADDGALLFHKRQEITQVAVHEVIFATVNKPKLLNQLSALLWDIALIIHEAHVFSTTDGYSLDVFVVNGWPVEDKEGLHKAMAKAIARSELKSGDWEIDRRLLKIGERIASGSCGDVCRGVYLGQDVAVKVLKSDRLNDTQEKEFAQEVTILRQVQHRNVVRLIGTCTKSPCFCIVTEYMPGGSLYDYLHKSDNVLRLPQLLKFAIDVSKGMEYLHQKNIIHRDLKTLNLLMDTDKVVKVADFGVARFQSQGGVMTAETGTYKWMAPEIMDHQPYDQKADVFSFAIVLWELATAKVPYDTMNALQAAIGVRQGLRPELPKDAHPKLLDLMQRCWETTPDKRPSFSEITVELETLLREVQETSEAGSSG